MIFKVFSMLSQTQVTGKAVSHELMSALGLCALKQRSWLEDRGPVGRQSFPAVTDAASRSSCSATCSVTAGTVAQMSKTAKHVSTAQADFSEHIKGAVGEMKSTKCHRDVIRKRSYPSFWTECFVIYVNTCAPCLLCALYKMDMLLWLLHMKGGAQQVSQTHRADV